LFSSFPHQHHIYIFFPHACYMPRAPHSAWLENLQRI
jgi:hypothetical protein